MICFEDVQAARSSYFQSLLLLVIFTAGCCSTAGFGLEGVLEARLRARCDDRMGPSKAVEQEQTARSVADCNPTIVISCDYAFAKQRRDVPYRLLSADFLW